MKIIISTLFTTYSKGAVISPKSKLWFLKNTGNHDVLINQVHKLYTTSQFGMDNTDIIIPSVLSALKGEKNKIIVETDTQFDLSFKPTISPGYYYPNEQFLLVETFFKIENNGIHII